MTFAALGLVYDLAPLGAPRDHRDLHRVQLHTA